MKVKSLRKDAPVIMEIPVLDFNSGDKLSNGPYIGFEDMATGTETIESILPTGGEVIGKFENGKPAIIRTANTLYIAKDISWADDNWRKLIKNYNLEAGVKRWGYAENKDGEDIGEIDVSPFEGKDFYLYIITNSPLFYGYESKKEKVCIKLLGRGPAYDILDDTNIPWMQKDEYVTIEMNFKLGEGGEVVVIKLEK